MAKRTDCHRPGAIIPKDYSYECSYCLPGNGEETESWNDDEALAITQDHKKQGKIVYGNLGTCGICGASFRYGDIWFHENGDLIHLGHDCADKYDLLARRTDFNKAVEQIKRNHKARLEALAQVARFDRFCANHEGLAQAFTTKHYIISDIASKLRQYGSLSDKQVALVMKISKDEAEKASQEEKHVPAPEGKVVIRGKVLSRKIQDSTFGSVLRMTVKVETPEGSWLAWGTVPASLEVIPQAEGLPAIRRVERGDEVEFTATLSRGDTPHFAFYKRPSKARLISKSA